MAQKTFKINNLPAVRRLPLYWHFLCGLRDRGGEVVSTTVIADGLQLDAIQVRKDLAITGITGKPRVGYPIATLIAAIEAFLGWDSENDACLIGVGNLGSALLGNNGFSRYGLNIVAAFDADPEKCHCEVHGLTVLPIEKMPDLVARLHLRIAILTVPSHQAQEIAEQLVAAGISGIWNFTPAGLVLPAEIVVQNEDLASGLAVLSHKLAQFQLHREKPALEGAYDA